MAELPSFDRRFLGGAETFTVLGSGEIGGKAAGLRGARGALVERPPALRFERLAIEVPTLTVIGTDVFDDFLALNRLAPESLAGRDDREVAHAFQRGELPPGILGDLWALVRELRVPLAVRSSSRLEDALAHPFAGVYATKMTPNNQLDPESRFRRLVEAVKFVYASTFFEAARSYRAALGRVDADEKMAVVVQEVVGRRHGPRFYPDVSCVARSFNFYPFGPAGPADGVMSLALGLGKQIVDGGRCYSVSPRHPQVGPPFSSPREALGETQARFWAVNMGSPPAFDPVAETEYLLEAGLDVAEQDETLRWTASTYDPQRDRIATGIGARGPRVLDFGPLRLFDELPWSAAVGGLLELFQERLGGPVEIELAATIEGGTARLGFLQVRPMAASGDDARVGEDELRRPDAVVASAGALGNGTLLGLRDVVLVKPDLEMRDSRAAAQELAQINGQLVAERCPYLLVGVGRWGSADPWLGIPVEWGQVSGARAIVEAASPRRSIEMSQGSHFFHNLLGLGVPYLSVPEPGPGRVDWEYLLGLPRRRETRHVVHAWCEEGLTVRSDGLHRRAVVLRGEPARG
jgi:hypothetical protein